MSRPQLSCRVLVLQPTKSNAYFRQCGHRLSRALTLAGADVTLASLDAPPVGRFDVGFAISLGGLSYDAGGDEPALKWLDEIRNRCDHFASVNLEPVKSFWFDHEIRLIRRLGLRYLLDMSIASQSAAFQEPNVEYVLLPYGLLPEERDELRKHRSATGARPLPWTFVGISTSLRVQFARRLIRDADPRGFLYLSEVAPIKEDGRHLDADHLHRILSRSQFYVWRAQGEYCYLEGERYRWSGLCGCAPLKVVSVMPDVPDLPFAESIIREDDIAEALRPEHAEERRQRFLDEYLSWPGLEELIVEPTHRIVGTREFRIAS